MFQLNIGNRVFSDVTDFDKDFSEFPAFAEAALIFCKSWFSGEESFIQETSGSTGVPKKIFLTREQMQASAEATGSFFKITPEDRLLCCLNPAYIAGKMMLVRAAVWKCAIWLVEPSGNPLESLSFSPDFAAMVPLQVQHSMQNPRTLGQLQAIKHLIIGGAPVSESLKRSLLDHHLAAWQTYGMTETVSHIGLAPIVEGPLIYEVLPTVEIGQDSRAALWVESPMSGSHRIQTNDLIELKTNTSFLWLGRVDFVINSGGIKLHPEQLERKAEQAIQEIFPGVRFFFFGEKDERLGEKLVLFIELSDPDPQLKESLRKRLKRELGKYEFPKAICFKGEFAMTPSGKIDRLKTTSNP